MFRQGRQALRRMGPSIAHVQTRFRNSLPGNVGTVMSGYGLVTVADAQLLLTLNTRLGDVFWAGGSWWQRRSLYNTRKEP